MPGQSLQLQPVDIGAVIERIGDIPHFRTIHESARIIPELGEVETRHGPVAVDGIWDKEVVSNYLQIQGVDDLWHCLEFEREEGERVERRIVHLARDVEESCHRSDVTVLNDTRALSRLLAQIYWNDSRELPVGSTSIILRSCSHGHEERFLAVGNSEHGLICRKWDLRLGYVAGSSIMPWLTRMRVRRGRYDSDCCCNECEAESKHDDD